MKFGLLAALLTGASAIAYAAPAAISGIVRDTQGVAQMGVLVQVMASNTIDVGAAFTDIYGRYRIANLFPGKYEVRATAMLFAPATRGNLQLTDGRRAVVNLTMTMVTDTTAWLPAERRKADEPDDDWKWTLRSAANRPVLRMLEDGQMVAVSSSAEATRAMTQARESMVSGDGGFGGGGVHTVLTLDRIMEDGSGVVVRTDVAAARTPYGRGPSTELDAGYERAVGFGGASRLVVNYQSHPEIMSDGTALGMQMMQMSSAQKIRLGDLADIEAGGTVYAVHTTGYAVASRPFVRVSLHPSENWTLGYRMATSRDLQGFNSLDSVEAPLPKVASTGGHFKTEAGRHQEIMLNRQLGSTVVQAAVYTDTIQRAVLSGTGILCQADLLPTANLSSGVVDTVTDSFQFLAAGYKTHGLNLTVTQPLTTSLWAAVQYEDGAALTTRDAIAAPLAELSAGLHAISAQSATIAVKGRMLRSGTKIRAAYRWQPRRLVTAVGPYEAFSDQAYLGFYLRQSVRWGNMLPPGLTASIDVTNLLAQGYQPFLSADGRTLFLAQSPRTIQGGLSFTF